MRANRECGTGPLVPTPQLPPQLYAASLKPRRHWEIPGKAAEGTEVVVRRVQCLANCSRGPSAAVRCNGSWAYIFGGLDEGNAGALIDGARLLANAADGIMPWRGRPEPLKRSLVARVP